MGKTATIHFNNVKSSDGWMELANDLGIPRKRANEIFEYGEYGDFYIEVDENLNIVGGKIIPCT